MRDLILRLVIPIGVRRGRRPAEFRISQPAVSQHLSVLREAILVRPRHEGRNTYYRIDPRGLRPLVDWIALYKAFWTDRVGKLQALLEEMDQ